MAQFEITITKVLSGSNGEIWTNNYNVLAATILDAADIADQISAIEQDILWDNVQIIAQRIGPVSGLGAYTRNIALVGSRSSGDPLVQLPLFNTVLVAFLAATGRPSLKYLRLPLVEVEVEGFNITEDHVTFLNTNYSTPLIALDALCNQAGQAITAAYWKRPVQMRQLKWHRRTRPGFHRGYVPD